MIIYLSLIAIFFSGTVCGIIGFGDALILMPVITPLIGVKNAVILVNLWSTLASFLNFLKYREFFDRGYYLRFIRIGIPATILGTILILGIRLEWIELILGFFIFSYSILKLYQYYKKPNNFELKRVLDTKSPLIFFGGFSYGFLAALISAAGPINVAVLEKTGHYRESFIENFAVISFTLSMVRNPLYFITGIFPFELLLLFFLGFPTMIIGTKFGHKFTPKIPVKTFETIIFCFLLIISIKTIFTSFFSLLY